MKQKELGNCPKCKHYEHSFDGEKHTKTCLVGHNTQLLDWWQANGHKTVGHGDNMDCFEPTQYASDIKEMSDILEKMNVILEKHVSNKNIQTPSLSEEQLKQYLDTSDDVSVSRFIQN